VLNFSPLGGGFFYLKKGGAVEPGSRFDNPRLARLVDQYKKDSLFEAKQRLEEVSAEYGITMSQLALRWLHHHSQLKEQYGDAVIFGGSKLKHFEETIEGFGGGELPAKVVAVVEEIWPTIEKEAPWYQF